MRSHARRMGRSSDNEGDINLTPMLDVVFIMLIFFIVTATFIKQPGVDVTRPEAETAVTKPAVSVLVAVTAKGEIWIDKKLVDVNTVRSQIERVHSENPKGGLVIQADKGAKAEKLLAVIEAGRQAGITDLAISTEED